MRTLKLVLSYDGTEYHGWQRQPNGRSLQETLEEALFRITSERLRTVASGRTDAGVHALGQVVHFRTQSELAPQELVLALNAHLPNDFVVRSGAEVPAGFHARYDVKRKLYRYVFCDAATPDPFLRRYCWHTKFRLDACTMHRAAQCLLEQHDFHSFETEWPNRPSSMRAISHIAVCRAAGAVLLDARPISKSKSRDPKPQSVEDDLAFVCLEVEADGFLYNMVRAIAGTLHNVGRGFWPEEKVREILTAKDRRQAGPTAPPQGLFLVRVEY